MGSQAGTPRTSGLSPLITLNSRPRKTNGWETAAEALDEHLRSFKKTVLPPLAELGQCTPPELANRLHDWRLVGRCGSVGDCLGNAAMGTFWAPLKNEVRHIWGPIDQRTRSEMRTNLFDYIETFYVRTRHQAGLDHRSSAKVCASAMAGEPPSPCPPDRVTSTASQRSVGSSG